MSHSLFTHYKMQNYVVVETNEVDTVSKVKNGYDINFFLLSSHAVACVKSVIPK